MPIEPVSRIEYFAAEAMKQFIHEHFEWTRHPNNKNVSDYCPVDIADRAFRTSKEMEEITNSGNSYAETYEYFSGRGTRFPEKSHRYPHDLPSF